MREAPQHGVEGGLVPRDPVPECERTFDENGVDLTLVRYTLSLSPTERLLAVEKFMNALATVRPKPQGSSK